MRAYEIGQRMLELGKPEEACRAFTLLLTADEMRDAPAEERMDAAVSLLRFGEDYRVPYDAFLRLYREDRFREDILPILSEAFYQPNLQELRNRYEKNVKQLRHYPYLFRRDFPAYDALPLLFFPYDDHTYAPFDTRTGEFLPLFRPRYEEITRNFFRDLERPVFASDVYSQYELEYLRDNVRRSEDVGRENHIYLHYTDWAVFCAYLAVLDARPLLEGEKIVFLMEDEESLYPIDFQARFGIDYSRYPVKPVGIREVTRLIWHTQLSAHNGGDFFNQIMDCHPNLITVPSVLFSAFEEEVETVREALRTVRNLKDLQEQILDHWENPELVAELYRMRSPSDKDILVAIYLGQKEWNLNRDPASRIAPAVFFQPHFQIILYQMNVPDPYHAEPFSEELNRFFASPMLRGFRYIKTFTPLRRFTTSCGGAIRYYHTVSKGYLAQAREGNFTELKGNPHERTKEDWFPDWETRPDRIKQVWEQPRIYEIRELVSLWCIGRSFMTDPENRLFRDSRVVRFEDGKLNPKATFTRLAAFLDLPYTDSMTYCSEYGVKDPYTDLVGYSAGFNPHSVYTDQGGFIDDSSRKLIEFFLRDAYRFYGYDLQYYHGEPVDWQMLDRWIAQADTVRGVYRTDYKLLYEVLCLRIGFRPLTEAEEEELIDGAVDKTVSRGAEMLRALLALGSPVLINRNGVPLQYCPLLRPDPDLLDQPLYH